MKSEIQCQACGSKNTIIQKPYVHSYREAGVWGECSKCGSFVLMNPDSLEEETKYLNTRPWGETSNAQRLIDFKKDLYKNVVEKAKSFNPPPGKLLDVGCCYGGLVEVAKSQGYEVYGYDILKDAVEQVRQKDIVCHQASTANEFKEKCNVEVFDIITCVDVHYYWRNQKEEIETLIKMLTPDGVFILRARTMNWLVRFGGHISKILPAQGKWMIKKSLRDYQFATSAEQLITIIKNCGGEVVYASPSGAIPGSNSSFKVKLYFAFSSFIWKVFRKDISIGFLICFKKQKRGI